MTTYGTDDSSLYFVKMKLKLNQNNIYKNVECKKLLIIT